MEIHPWEFLVLKTKIFDFLWRIQHLLEFALACAERNWQWRLLGWFLVYYLHAACQAATQQQAQQVKSALVY